MIFSPIGICTTYQPKNTDEASPCMGCGKDKMWHFAATAVKTYDEDDDF